MRNNLIRRHIVIVLSLVYLITVILVPTGAIASTNSTWTGNGSDDNWSIAENWSGNTLPTGDGTCAVNFGDSPRMNPTIDSGAPSSVKSVLFQWDAGSSYTLSGNPLTIAESVSTQDQGAEKHTINNNITFTSDASYISPGLGKNLSFGGTISSNSTLLVRGNGWSTIELLNTAAVTADELVVSAADAPYGPVTLQLDHAVALADSVVLKLVPNAANENWKAKVNLNFPSEQKEVVDRLFLNGVEQPAGTYNAATNPDYFSGTGSLQVTGEETPPPDPTTTPAAIDVTWTGNGGDDNWSTAENWSGNTLPAGDGTCAVKFGDSPRMNPTIDSSAPSSVKSILFQWDAGSSYTLSGNPLTIAESVSTQDQGAEKHTINNNITFSSTTPYIAPGLGKNLSFVGTISGNSTLLVKGNGWSTIELLNTAAVTTDELVVSAADAPYGPVTLQLDHAVALADSVVLKLVPNAANENWKAKVNLNFPSEQKEVVDRLFLNGVEQPAGTYNASTNPDYFSGTGSLQVINGAGTTPEPTPGGTMHHVLLELGSNPDRLNDPDYKVYKGTCTWTPDAESAAENTDDWSVNHSGFGTWGALFKWNTPDIVPGYYKFKAKYKSGGEVSQVEQSWTLFSQPAGGWKYRYWTKTLNNTPWEYQTCNGSGRLLILPGDTEIDILNEGKADGAKIFDEFELIPDEPVPEWLDSTIAAYRAEYMGKCNPYVTNPQKYIFVVDGNTDGDTANDEQLFTGLTDSRISSFYNTAKATYLLGAEADKFAADMNITERPAVVIADSSYSVLGVLSSPATVQQVVDFIADPAAKGYLPEPPTISQPAAAALNNGIPEKWLIGGINGGRAGLELYGIDSDKRLRPNPGNRYTQTNVIADIGVGTWDNAAPQADGKTTVVGSTPDNTWAKQTGYAQLYMYTAQSQEVVLHLEHNGIEALGWLDETPLSLVEDINVPSEFPALPEGSDTPKTASLHLSEGWHSLKIKTINALPANSEFFFAAKFTDLYGSPVTNIQTQTADPQCDLTKNAFASRLLPAIRVNAPANIPHPGEAITVNADMKWHPMDSEKSLSQPILAFSAVLRLTMTDYSGNVVATREVTGNFPGQVTVDFGSAPAPGYYAIRPELYTTEGTLIAVYPTDGFTVTGGTEAQKARLANKKVWDNYYYAFGDNSPSDNWNFISTWIERMGLFQTMGSNQMVNEDDLIKWQDAKDRGLNVFADFSGDSSWINNTQTDCQNYVDKVNAYTRFYKSTNELDTRSDASFQALRDPAHWVSRSQWEYETVKAANPDAFYAGASLVRPGDMNNSGYPNGGPGYWFTQCLNLGLEQWVDAWDVHAYPQHAPNLDSMFGNSPVEDAPGVEAAYASIGSTNTKPFIYGEVGAIANHGESGQRWQAEAVAKMIAWVCSRDNYLGIAFCVAHENNIDRGRQWGYTMGRRPGEAALATASALIDGLAYTAVISNDNDVDLAKFGNTYMAWKKTDGSKSWTMHLPGAGPWVIVDVVGQKRPLAVNGSNDAIIRLTQSPVYILTQEEYSLLTGISGEPEADTTAPVLTAGTVSRTGDTTAEVRFTSSEAGQYYYKIVNDGEAAPEINTVEAGTACTSGETTVTNPAGLTAGAKDMYILVKDAAGNISLPLKIDIESMPPQNDSPYNQAAPVTREYTISGNNITLIPGTVPGGNTAWIDLSEVNFNNIFENMPYENDGKQKVLFDFNKAEAKQSYKLQLPSAIFKDSSERVYEISTPVCSLSVSGDMFRIADESKKIMFTIEAADRTKLDKGLQKMIGQKPVIELNAYLDGKLYDWTDTANSVSVSIPYSPEPQDLKNQEHLTVLLIDGNGAHPVFSGRYNRDLGKMVFKTNHLSQYAVAFVTKSFSDIAEYAWARESIEIMASKGILRGVSADQYAPARQISRADFLLYLVRTLGISAEFATNFDDVKPGTDYYKAVGVARKLGITIGTGDNKFQPDAPLSRQDMMTLTAKALKIIGRVNETTGANALKGFSDQSDIASYAVLNVSLLVENGIVAGDGKRINPQSNTTRAEAAVILHKLYNRYE